MREAVLRAYTIGQTPRPDLTGELEHRLPGTPISVVGALDGLPRDRIQSCEPCDHPLETRLRDGTRIVVDAATVEARLQRILGRWDGEALAHLVLCAGPFPSLTVPPDSRGRAAPLIRPFETAVRTLRERGLEKLAVLSPFEAQVGPGRQKWLDRGFATLRVRALTEKPATASTAKWIASWVSTIDAQAVVFDYVGFPADVLAEVRRETGLPVIDLGHLALDHLTELLMTPDAKRPTVPGPTGPPR